VFKDKTITVILPTYNAEKYIKSLLISIVHQTVKPDFVIIIDSSSSDNTVSIAKQHNIKLITIKKEDFNHGGTRKLAAESIYSDYYIFMTQDSVLAAANSFECLISAFDDPDVGCAYGRQFPRIGAPILESHLRLFNYPAENIKKSIKDKYKYGIKTCFNSDSFSAYRKIALDQIGNFPEKIILGEDVYVAAKMLKNGWKVAYKADASVYHSHHYSLKQDFCRYFDIGVFHAMNKWILDDFASPEKEGFKYVKSELQYCFKHKEYWQCIMSLFKSIAKYSGYFLGRRYYKIPKQFRKQLSMTKNFWNQVDLD
jgi:rhamnosyltransferase